MVSQFWVVLAVTLLISSNAQGAPRLVLAQQLFRHGARYPYSAPDYIPDVETNLPLADLTTEGKHMHYLLGRQIFDNYWEKLFGDNLKYNTTKVYVRTTNTTRTIESAESHLAGFFERMPPLQITQDQVQFSTPAYKGIQPKPGKAFGRHLQDFHPFPVYLSNSSELTALKDGDFLQRWRHENCKKQDLWNVVNLKTPQAVKMLNHPRYIRALDILSKELKLDFALRDPSNFSNLYDYYECLRYLGMEVPPSLDWPSEGSPTDEQVSLRSLYSLVLAIKYFGNQQQWRVSASEIFDNTINNFNSVIKDKEAARQMIFYSAHDLTVNSVLRAINLTNSECIYNGFVNNITHSDSCIFENAHFAASLTFELYQYENTDSYTFKLNYNGDYLPLPFCEGRTECGFARLKAWHSTWRVNNVRETCGVPSYPLLEATLNSSTTEMTGLGLVIFVVSLLLNFLLKVQSGADEAGKSKEKKQ